MAEAKADMLAFPAFPKPHWKQIWSTNLLELVNKEIKRRTDVAGVFPNSAAQFRLAGAVLFEQHDEWAVADRRFFAEHTRQLLDKTTTTPILLTLALADQGIRTV